jgi:hypothetical protein
VLQTEVGGVWCGTGATKKDFGEVQRFNHPDLNFKNKAPHQEQYRESKICRRRNKIKNTPKQLNFDQNFHFYGFGDATIF